MDRNYELVVILDPDLKAEEQDKLVNKIKKTITSEEVSASKIKVKELGKKNLQYPLRKKTMGTFLVFEFIQPANLVASIKQKLQLEENILRFLLVVNEEGRSA